MVVVDNAANVDALARAMASRGPRRWTCSSTSTWAAVAPARSRASRRSRSGAPVTKHRALRLRGLQGYAGHCAHVMGWAARREASHKAMAPLMETRTLFERAGLPVEIVAGGSTGTHDIDVELAGLTELQSGSYCVMDLDYRRIGGREGEMLTDFEMALTVLATVVSVPTADRAMVDARAQGVLDRQAVSARGRRARPGSRTSSRATSTAG